MTILRKMFTLIELIVVIVVLGILAAIVIPNISSWQKEAEVTAIGSNVRNLQTSVDMYSLDNTNLSPVAGEQPEEFIPKPIDFDKIHPDYTRNLPKIKGVKYWIDFQGKIWASTIDSPEVIDISSGVLTWNKVTDAQYYNVYQVEGYKGVIGSAYKSSSLKFISKVEVDTDIATPSYSGKTGIAYVVSAVDENGFESAPSGIGYKGYDSHAESKNPPKEEPIVLVPLVDSLQCTDLQGDGSIENPYLIFNANELNAIRHCRGKNYKLMANIDLSNYGVNYNNGEGWLPLAYTNVNYSFSESFSGLFDGNGHTIHNLFINEKNTNWEVSSGVGLFGSIKQATIKNLGLENVNVTGPYAVGPFGGKAENSLFDQVYSTGTVYNNRNNGLNGDAAGIVGTAYKTTIKNSYSLVNPKNIGHHLGGLVGNVWETIILNSYSTGIISAGTEHGGLIGGDETQISTITNSYWDIELSKMTYSLKGEGKTTSEMKIKETYKNWDFENIWLIDGDNYPTLRWQVQ